MELVGCLGPGLHGAAPGDAQQAARRRDADELNLERKRMGAEGEQSGKEPDGQTDTLELTRNVRRKP